MTTLVLFAHGKESGPWGAKIRSLAKVAERLGAIVESPSYEGMDDADERVQRLLGLSLPAHDQLVLVGSSMGGYVSVEASAVLKPAGLFLMAPAVYLDRPGFSQQHPRSGARHTTIAMGWNDEAIPVANVIRFAEAERAALHLVDDNHRLTASQPMLDLLLERLLIQVMHSGNESMPCTPAPATLKA